jgi:hypothetical protein
MRLTSVNTKFNFTIGTKEGAVVCVSCILCEYWYNFFVDMWNVKYCIKDTVYDNIFTSVWGAVYNVLIRSILGKIRLPSNWLLKSWRCGMGYLSGLVMLFRARQPPQGRQEPSFFGTKWIGLGQALCEGWQIPMLIICWNSSLAARSLWGGSLRAFAITGCPAVSIVCVTVVGVGEKWKFSWSTFGSCFRMSLYLWSSSMRCTDSIPETITRVPDVDTDVVESMSHLCFISTNRLWWWRKSAPIDCTLAMRKFHGMWRRNPRCHLPDRVFCQIICNDRHWKKELQIYPHLCRLNICIHLICH